MKAAFIFVLCFTFSATCAVAQDRSGRDPAGVERSPAGEKSGPERGSTDSKKQGDASSKSGKGSASKEAKATAETIKDVNSVDGKGEKMTDAQRAEAARQMGAEQVKAAAVGNQADAKFFGKEKDKLTGKKK